MNWLSPLLNRLRALPRLPWKKPGLALRLVAWSLLLVLAGFTLYLDITIREAFEGRKFALPARVYGRALEVYPGLKLTPARLVEELRALGYRENPEPQEAATYRHVLDGVEFTTRDFVFWDGPSPASACVRCLPRARSPSCRSAAPRTRRCRCCASSRP